MAKQPLYERVRDALRERIRRGVYKPNDQIPATSALCEEFDVSSITVRRAIQELVSEGLLSGRAGKGVFVSEPARTPGEKLIGVVLPDVAGNPFFGEIIEGIESKLSPAGYHMVFGISRNDLDREEELLDEMRNRGVDGMIFTPVSDTSTPDAVHRLLEREIPTVFLDRKLPNVPVDYAGSSNEEGGYQATSHLLELGHRRIAFLYALGANTVQDRLRGYLRALNEKGLSKEEDLILGNPKPGLDYADSGEMNTTTLLRMKHRPTAIFACSDAIAIGIYRALAQEGVRIPQDVSVVGYDDLPHSSCVMPPLTTVRQPRFAMGERAAELLLRRLAGSAAPTEDVLLKSELIVRASAASPSE